MRTQVWRVGSSVLVRRYEDKKKKKKKKGKSAAKLAKCL
jgi:hypothetical protein